MGKGFDPAKHRQWRDVLRRQKQSGLSIRGFCERESLSEARFHWWRRELARRSSVASHGEVKSSQRKLGKVVRRSAAVTLLPLEVSAVSGASAIEIVLPSGVLLRIRAGTDTQLLREVLAALQPRPC
jgi:hypothetical protein